MFLIARSIVVDYGDPSSHRLSLDVDLKRT